MVLRGKREWRERCQECVGESVTDRNRMHGAYSAQKELKSIAP